MKFGTEGTQYKRRNIPIEKSTLKELRGHSRYNTIKKKCIEQFFEWILSHPNVKPSCVSSDFVTVLNP